MKARTLVVALAVGLGVPLVLGAAATLSLRVGLPERQSDRVRGPHGLVGVWTGRSYAWVVPAGDDVLLIDGGADREATALRAEIAGRAVLATLVTHGHVDHVAGIDAFPDAPLYLHADDLALAGGRRLPGGVAAAWWARASEVPRLPAVIREVSDGELLHVGTEKLRVVAAPGHTPGSVAYRWRDVLFVGDVVMVGDPLRLPPELLADDPVGAQRSVERLLPLDFAFLADGHVGVLGAGREALAAFLDAPSAPAEVALDAMEVGPAALTVEGRYVQRPLPDAQGLQPARIVADDGRVWVVASQPVPEHHELWQRRVRVSGVPVVEPAGWRPVGGAWLTVTELEALDNGPGGVQRVAESAVHDHDRAWVEVVGLLRQLEPLAPRAGRAQGQLGDLAVVAPASSALWVGERVTMLGRVSGDVLLVEAVCPGDVVGCGREPHRL